MKFFYASFILVVMSSLKTGSMGMAYPLQPGFGGAKSPGGSLSKIE